ncbi:hypothetical protein OKW28_006283 [Paraburkholderia sp. 40]
MARPRFEPTSEGRAAVRALLICGVPIGRCLAHVVNPQTHRPPNTWNVRDEQPRKTPVA